MNVFFDTNVLVAAVLAGHASHARALAALDRVQNGRDNGCVSAHTLAEMYSTLTRIPLPFRHSPEQALLSIDENVIKHFKIIALTGADYVGLVRDLPLLSIQGGATYDAILLRCALKSSADRIYTFNLKHFAALMPPHEVTKLASP